MDQWIALVLIGLAAALGMHALLAAVANWRLADNLGNISERRKRLPRPLALVHPILTRMSPLLGWGHGFINHARFTRLIITAGWEGALTSDEAIAFNVILVIGVSLVAIVLFDLPLMIALSGGSFVGFVLGHWILVSAARRRQQSIERALPTLLDWLTLLVEAGLDFTSALARIASDGRLGPLGEEVSRVVAEQRLGVARATSLKRFSARVDLPVVHTFVTTVIQAERMGSPIGLILRAHADRLREGRFQKAERAGAAAAQKILLPLVFFIIPTTFIVIVAPIVIRIVVGGWEALGL